MHKPQPSDPQCLVDVLLITRYCDGQLSAFEFDQLNDRLACDPVFRRLFIELVVQAEYLETVVTRPEAVFDEYAYIPPVAEAESLSARSIAKASGYLLREAVHNRALRKSFFVMAAVFVLAVALTLTIRFSVNVEPSLPGPAAESPAPIAPAVAVATLTGQHNARWDKASLKTGDALYPGQRLTLLHGSAEFTTERGAIAIIEAPCTVELIDSANALRLHTGQLVGYVESERAKGFTVQTPNARLVDIGTEFVVDVDPLGHTKLQVNRGAVDAAGKSSIGQVGPAQRVVADQAVRIAGRSASTMPAIQAVAFDPLLGLERFHPTIAGQLQWAGRVPADLRHNAMESPDAQIYLEQKNLLLADELTVDILPGQDMTSSSKSQVKPGSINLGTRVDVYLIHLDGPGDEEISTRFTLSFDRPILGVIARDQKLAATDQLGEADRSVGPTQFSPLGTFAGRGRGVEFLGDESLLWSADRRSCTILANTYHTDHLRFIVAAADQDQPFE